MTVVLEAAEVLALGAPGAVSALREALRGGLDPDAGVPRTIVDLAHGQSLLMPAEHGDWFGVKVVNVAPENPSLGEERINGLFLLHDALTLRPVAVMDGVALTNLRTPAVSVAGVLDVLRRRFGDSEGVRLVIFGSGPQSRGHADTIRAHLPIAGTTVVARSVESASRAGIEGAVALAAAEVDAVGRAVASADVVVAATTSRTPVFDGSLVRDDAVVLAVGSHEPDVRELDSALMGRATVVVESVATALRESGNVVLAIDDGVLTADRLVTMSGILDTDPATLDGRPVVLASSGMAWEDLVVGVAAYRAAVGRAEDRA
ncbi:Ornithine cyclodeaminase/mu-crystallin [Nostocoides japonicum T1-X7]|uniref:Ornithine cyclodeaminase/mu-crystallin n=1 Tax=Nostocoides japonicum T1-X7 TaxID=1194083 RepID=A0A077LX38_9MICO|nr:ornithine cyclodeaminase [Tetrasphaera japonica]CCH76500.1 Ornithine cyclodeaminase/mu-crystallin [Tetrasphaera japonica T1-X7]